MSSTLAAVRKVWAGDNAAPDEVEAIVAAVAAAGDDPRLEALLQARHPATPAAIAAFDGFVRVGESTLLLGDAPIPAGLRLEAMSRRLMHPCEATGVFSVAYRGPLFRYPLRGRRPLVATDASVVAGEALTEGDVDLHDVLLVFGAQEVVARLTAALAACGVAPEFADRLAARMVTHVRIAEPGDTGLAPGTRLSDQAFLRALGGSVQRAVAAAEAAGLPAELTELLQLAPAAVWDRWHALAPAWTDALRPEFPVGVPTLTGYALLARHRDPC